MNHREKPAGMIILQQVSTSVIEQTGIFNYVFIFFFFLVVSCFDRGGRMTREVNDDEGSTERLEEEEEELWNGSKKLQKQEKRATRSDPTGW